jgi:hypothetical protein
MKSVNSNSHFNGIRAVLLAPSSGQSQVKSKGPWGQVGKLFGRAVFSYFGAERRRLSQIFFTGQHWTTQPSAQNPGRFFNSCYRSATALQGQVPTMNFFQTVLQSIENPEHAGSQQDLHGMMSIAQLIPGVQGLEQQVRPILGVLRPHLQDALNEQQQNNGPAAVQQTVTNLSQPGTGVQEIINLFGQEGSTD